MDTGENPPLGAIIYYWLGKVTSKSKIKIVIKDESGATVACCESQNEKASNSRRPTCKEGLNRFVWDLTEDPPIKLDEGLKIRKYEPFAKSEGGPAGAKVQPGNYLVVLTANGESQEAELTVVKDPRVNTRQEDFEVQNSLYKEITTKLSNLNIAVNRIRLMKSQLENIDKIIPEEAEAASLLVGELELLEGQLVDTVCCWALLLMLLQLLLLLLLLLGCCCFLVDFHVGSRHRSRLGPRCGAKGPWRVPRHSAQRVITSKVTSVRGPERHDSASLRVTTAPYVMSARASGEFAP